MKRTKWFSGDETPARVGVYERKYEYGEDIGDGFDVLLSYWDGESWGFTQCRSSQKPAKSAVEHAAKFRFPVSGDQYLPWRGIEMVAT